MKRASYRCSRAPGHPLADSEGRIGEHRLVLYGKVGPGPHHCYWCGKLVDWKPGQRTKPGSLVVDHLDDDPRNNAPENLVASCHTCNTLRGHPQHAIKEGELFILLADGTRTRAKLKACEKCGKEFLSRLKDRASQEGRDRYCSRSCSRKGKPLPPGAGVVKLTPALVIEIRARYARGEESQLKLAVKYGVSQMTVCKLLRRETWKNV